jgi:hypothetical protein
MWRPLKHVKDSFLKFNEKKHVYSIDWDRNGSYVPNDLSVSSFVKRNFAAFDPDKTISSMRSNKKFWTKRKNYRGKSNDDIKKEWSARGLEARNAGTKLHKEIELFYLANADDDHDGSRSMVPLSMPIHLIGKSHEFDQFFRYATYMHKKGYTPLRVEWMVYSDRYHCVIGTIDMVYVSPRQPEPECPLPHRLKQLHVTLVDWKRIKAMKQWAQDKGTGPCSDVSNANFFHYSLQLNTYKYIIEHFYQGIEYNGVTYDEIVVDSMWLVVFHTNRKDYMRLKCPDMQDTVRKMMFERRAQLNKAKYY